MENNMNNLKNVVIGMLIGGLAGAAAMLLLAPQSGKRTRTQIQQKSNQLRNQTTDMVNKEIDQVRFDTNKQISNVQDKAGQLKQLGQEKLVKQLDHVSDVLDSGKAAIESV